MKQIVANKKINERLKVNLTETTEEPKAIVGEPGLSYVRSPKNKNFNDLAEGRRK